MSKRIPPKIPSERSWPSMAQTAHANSEKANKIDGLTKNSSTVPSAKKQSTEPQKSQNEKRGSEHMDRLDNSQSTAQSKHEAGLLINFARAQSPIHNNTTAEQKSVDQTGALGARGPVTKLDERSILQDMLQRLGGSLDDQMHNLVSGFLHSLPNKEASTPSHTAHSGQLGALAQVISIENKTPRVLPHHLDVDPLADPVARKDLEDMLTANGAKAQLLVALGAASENERAQLDAGKLTLGDFYGLAARGHFGQLAEQPVRYDVLRHKLASAGLDLEFHQLLQNLSDADSQDFIDGKLSPVQAFAALARARGQKE